jgi:uncharacterized RDD family membrane protein YckC
MFTIIGGDGKEYGPVTVDQVRTWITAGRANLDTKAKALGSDEWRPLRDFPEFAGSSVPPLVASADGDALRDASPAAGRGARIGAALINAFFYFLCTIPGSLLISRKLLEQYPELGQGGMPRLEDFDISIMMSGVMVVWGGIGVGILLQAILLAARGQNLGKMMLGLSVVSATTGQSAGVGRTVLLRFIFPVAIIIGLNLITAVVGFVFLLVDFCFIFREDGRCLHDLMAGTKVVKKR